MSNDQQRQFVTRVVGSKATWVDITSGMSVDGITEVFRSLQPGDLIVEHAIDAIHDGAQVKA
ncbi:hypothetical protein [Sphingomonas lycopersici]|uniref:Uncharacterized protein n=1 Tax=Sphingomonas lycopersici TaxID=2951807 RepID=A0AA41Z678_9SPHN|nr:hypothetical protein [Sphingomonas lycopersici]MCW6534295.1 hypothetical protein [Sphingomonas lycopersici]